MAVTSACRRPYSHLIPPPRTLVHMRRLLVGRSDIKRGRLARRTTMRLRTQRVALITMVALGAIVAPLLIAGAPTAEARDRPGTPNDQRAVATWTDRIEVSWTNRATEAVTFEINRDYVQEDIKFIPAWGGYGTRQSYTVSGLSPNHDYCFRIRARTGNTNDGIVSEQWSAWACALTPMIPEPPQVQSPQALSQTQIRVWWYPPT